MIIAYNTIKTDAQGLIKELQTYPYDKAFFLKIRNRDREANFKKVSNIKRAARFIYLNKTGFNGLYRVNKSGYYNVPFGTYNNPMICDENTILSVQQALRNTQISNDDFEKIIKYAKKGDFVYLDPPYDPLTATANFTSYSKE